MGKMRPDFKGMPTVILIVTFVLICVFSYIEGRSVNVHVVEQMQTNSKDEQKEEEGVLNVKSLVVEREPTEQVREAYRKADNTWNGSDLLERLNALEAYIKKYPDSPLCDDALMAIGSSYDSLGIYKGALEAYKKIKDVYPNFG